MRNRSFDSSILLGPAAVGIALVLWWTASVTNLVGPTLLATPAEVVEAIAESFASDAPRSEQIHLHALYTLERMTLGWSLGGLFGAAVGLVLGRVRRAYLAAEPLLEFLRSIPPVLVLPAFLVSFDYGEWGYLATIIFGCWPVMAVTVARGAQLSSPERQDLMTVFDVPRWVRAAASTVEILPSLFLGARLTLSIAVVISVVGEMVFTPRNGWALGALARDAEISFDTPRFYACVILVGAFGYLGSRALRTIEEAMSGQGTYATGE